MVVSSLNLRYYKRRSRADGGDFAQPPEEEKEREGKAWETESLPFDRSGKVETTRLQHASASQHTCIKKYHKMRRCCQRRKSIRLPRP